MATVPGVDFRIRNVNCDMSLDLIDDFGKQKYGTALHKDLKVPSIRMFGICENGEKCLANIHGFLPFFYIRTRAPFSQDIKQQIGKVVVRCAHLLDVVLVAGYPLLAAVEPVEFKDIYGFHPETDYFIKVIFYDPILCHRIGITLQKECGKNDLLQPYQVHIPYILSFFIEYNIVGMGIVRFKSVSFRRISKAMEQLHPDYTSLSLKPYSHMANEFDVFCDDIIIEKSASMQTHFIAEYQISGLEALWKEEETRCRLGNTELIRPERPEWGVPVIKTEREAEHLQSLKKILNEYLSGDPDMSQTSQISDHRRSNFSQTQAILDVVDKGELSLYVQNAIQEETNEDAWQRNERLQSGEEEEATDAAQELEMTQIVSSVPTEPSTTDIASSDEEGDECERAQEVEADYPQVFLEPFQNAVASPPSDYSNPRSNETWCGDVTYLKPLNKTKAFKLESPTKLSTSQKAASELFKSSCSVGHFSVLSLEALFICNKTGVDVQSDKASNKKYLPNPETDPCVGIFYTLYKDVCNKFTKPDDVGGCVLEDLNFNTSEFACLKTVSQEKDLFRWLGMFFRQHDPDIIVGYDIKRLSFNYIIQRAAALGMSSFNEDVSRLAPRWSNEFRKSIDDLKGRILLNVWKIVRRENPLRHYRMSAVVNDILKKKYADLSQFFIEKLLSQNNEAMNAVILRHFLRRSSLNIEILVALDIFIRTSQMALVYGIQFTEVLSRGSQFRVESMLLRLAKLHGFCAPSVSIEQRNSMPSPETIPLTMEPKSGIYYDPVVVLDFQSLYPSVCIAYNYCFSTCIGTIDEWRKYFKLKSSKFQLGALPYDPPLADYIATLRKQGQLHISPVGGIFVKKEVRKSLIGQMLEELLETRVMVKSAMKKYKKDEVLKRLLNARQLALKLIANVTYGYTAANWSGRMPNAEVADAIVSKGREALENAIKMIEADADKAYRGSQVIYGDTDSLFVLMPGLSKEEAFVVGRKIADDVTACNPYPMKLKFEKVMMPCCLLAKKRYVGMSYEAEEEEEGVFDAKGIETIRRDACEFVAHSFQVILKLIFEKDFQAVMQYLQYKIENINKVPLKQFILSSDFRGNYAEGAVLPVKKIAGQLEKISTHHTPAHGDRIEFIIAEPPPDRKGQATVYSCVFRLEKFVEIPELKVHYTYYINRKLLPALSRVFQLIPMKVHWFSNTADLCLGCGTQGEIWCSSCNREPKSLISALEAARKSERKSYICSKVCQECVKLRPTTATRVPCYNVNCNIWQRRYEVQSEQIITKIQQHRYKKAVKLVPLPNVIE